MPDIIEEACTRFRRSKHSNDFTKPDLSPHLQLLSDDGHWIPPYLFIGRETMVSQIFGWQWAQEAIGLRGMPARSIGDALAGRYQEVSQTRAPAFDRVICRWKCYYFDYKRAIFPTEFGEGGRSFSVIIHLDRTLVYPASQANTDFLPGYSVNDRS